MQVFSTGMGINALYPEAIQMSIAYIPGTFKRKKKSRVLNAGQLSVRLFILLHLY